MNSTPKGRTQDPLPLVTHLSPSIEAPKAELLTQESEVYTSSGQLRNGPGYPGGRQKSTPPLTVLQGEGAGARGSAGWASPSSLQRP